MPFVRQEHGHACVGVALAPPAGDEVRGAARRPHEEAVVAEERASGQERLGRPEAVVEIHGGLPLFFGGPGQNAPVQLPLDARARASREFFRPQGVEGL